MIEDCGPIVLLDTEHYLSEHFTKREMIKSNTGERLGIDNTPTPLIWERLSTTCISLLEPIRKLIQEKVGNYPITVNSGYRCPALNKAVGGSKTSQHMEGEAADIECFAMSTEQLYLLITKSKLEFDQCIHEKGWVHVSYSLRHKNKREAFRV